MTRRAHAYAASFADELAKGQILAHTRRGDTVLDAFGGAFTTVIQARALRRSAIAIDVDPVACLIGRVMTKNYAQKDLESAWSTVIANVNAIEAMLRTLEFREGDWPPGSAVRSAGFVARVPEHERISYWFSSLQRAILAHLVGFSGTLPDPWQRDLVRVAISSSIIHKWPNTLSLAMDIDHTRPHRIDRIDLTPAKQVQIFRRAFQTVIALLGEHQQKAAPRSEIIQGDAATELARIPAESVDYVLTSPPYFNAIDYPRSHQFTHWWLWPEESKLRRGDYVGLKPSSAQDYTDAASEILRRATFAQVKATGQDYQTANRYYRYVVDLDAVVSGLARVLRPRKALTFVVANNYVNGVCLPVVDTVRDIFQRHGLYRVHADERKLDSAHRRYPAAFKGLMGSEYIVAGFNHARPVYELPARAVPLNKKLASQSETDSNVPST
jgi:DNA modification methylase